MLETNSFGSIAFVAEIWIVMWLPLPQVLGDDVLNTPQLGDSCLPFV
jgi:hypothetical protein